MEAASEGQREAGEVDRCVFRQMQNICLSASDLRFHDRPVIMCGRHAERSSRRTFYLVKKIH